MYVTKLWVKKTLSNSYIRKKIENVLHNKKPLQSISTGEKGEPLFVATRNALCAVRSKILMKMPLLTSG